MKALSIKQPWASLIAHGIKDIENRTWKTNFRGRIFIHASGVSAGRPAQLLNDVQLNFMVKQSNFRFFDTALITSAIIGEVDIIDCVINHPSIWAEKTDISNSRQTTSGVFVDKPIYNWVLANPVLYEKPILNVKGKLSFWETDYQHCEDCNSVNHISTMSSIDECWTCKKCVAEYEEMVAKEEIEPE